MGCHLSPYILPQSRIAARNPKNRFPLSLSAPHARVSRADILCMWESQSVVLSCIPSSGPGSAHRCVSRSTLATDCHATFRMRKRTSLRWTSWASENREDLKEEAEEAEEMIHLVLQAKTPMTSAEYSKCCLLVVLSRCSARPAATRGRRDQKGGRQRLRARRAGATSTTTMTKICCLEQCETESRLRRQVFGLRPLRSVRYHHPPPL